MIRTAALELAAALRAQLGETVTVLDAPPDSAAAPVVYVELLGAGWADALYTVEHRAVAVVDAGLLPGSRAEAVGYLGDHLLAAARKVVGPTARLRLVTGRLEVGDVSYPTLELAVTAAFTHCELPQPIPLSEDTYA